MFDPSRDFAERETSCVGGRGCCWLLEALARCCANVVYKSGLLHLRRILSVFIKSDQVEEATLDIKGWLRLRAGRVLAQSSFYSSCIRRNKEHFCTRPWKEVRGSNGRSFSGGARCRICTTRLAPLKYRYIGPDGRGLPVPPRGAWMWKLTCGALVLGMGSRRLR